MKGDVRIPAHTHSAASLHACGAFPQLSAFDWLIAHETQSAAQLDACSLVLHVLHSCKLTAHQTACQPTTPRTAHPVFRNPTGVVHLDQNNQHTNIHFVQS